MAASKQHVPSFRDSIKGLLVPSRKTSSAEYLVAEALFIKTMNAILAGTTASDELADKSITAPKLADNAVQARSLGDGVVGSEQIGDNQVIRSKLSKAVRDELDGIGSGGGGTGEIAEDRFGAKTIPGSAIKDDAIDNRTLGDSAVQSENIAGLSVTRVKLAEAVTDELDKIGAATSLDGQIVAYANLVTQLQTFVDLFFSRSTDTAKLPNGLVKQDTIASAAITTIKLMGLASVSSSDNGKAVAVDGAGGFKLVSLPTTSTLVSRGLRYGFTPTAAPSKETVDGLTFTEETSITLGVNTRDYRLVFAAIHERITSISIGGLESLSAFDLLMVDGYRQVLVSSRALIEDVYNGTIVTLTVTETP